MEDRLMQGILTSQIDNHQSTIQRYGPSLPGRRTRQPFRLIPVLSGTTLKRFPLVFFAGLLLADLAVLLVFVVDLLVDFFVAMVDLSLNELAISPL